MRDRGVWKCRRSTLFGQYTGDRETLISTYAGALMGLKTLETQFPGLMDKAVEVAKDADVVEMEIKKPFASLFSRLFGR